MSEEIDVVVYGLGYIGGLVARKLLEEEGVRVIGCIDVAPDKVGRDLGELLGLEPLGVPVVHDRDALDFLMEVRPDVAVLATGSFLDKIYPQLVKCIRAGVHVVSTCETLAYPWYRYPGLAARVDREAKENNVSVIGTGVNPGFIFDALPAFLSLVCTEVRSISVVRSINAGRRRYSFQKKIGLGLEPEEFNKLMKEGMLTGHVGYAESVMLLASILGVEIDKVEERQESLIAETFMKTDFFNISPGKVRGVRGLGVGYRSGEEFIRLEFIAAVDNPDYDEIVIEADPPQRWRSEGVFGDSATAGMVTNVVKKILEAPRGLITMKDLFFE
ncbi:MAG: dihydrodipicolinate reductase [Thermoprotei archaeon]|nr:MAG: dihydrodipicolinate reductase [Thermoprotei archaeon]